MKLYRYGIIAATLLIFGCDDGQDINLDCGIDCVHGTCMQVGTQKRCSCEDEYSTDDAGACTVASAPHFKIISEPRYAGEHVEFDIKLIDVEKKVKNPKLMILRDGNSVTYKTSDNHYTVNDSFATGKKLTYVISAIADGDVSVEPLYYPIWREEKKFDWRDAIMYFAFIDRFLNGDASNDHKLNILYDWHGGDIAGLKQKVEEGYFDKLGVNALWISSINMNTQKALGPACAYHSYWPLTVGYTNETAPMFENATSNGVPITLVEPHFGTLSELKSLIRACHDRGIRVLVDFAVNHVADDSPVYIQHPDWFNHYGEPNVDSYLCEGPTDPSTGKLSQQNWNIIPETCWFSTNLPDFNYNKPEVRKFVIDHAKWLIQETGIDGFRLDAVKHMPKLFIRELREGIDELFKDTDTQFYIVGETFDGESKISEYIGENYLHGQFDFPLYNKIRDTIMNGDGKFYSLKDFTSYIDTYYGDALMSTFLGNHDVARAISHIHHDSEEKYGDNAEVTDTWAYRQLRLAWTFLLTSPKIPMIYYGDEYGLEGANDPDNRRPMEFGNVLNAEQQATLQLVQTLGQLRHQHSAMSRGKRINVNAKDRSYMYMMQDENETILVGINDSDDPQEYKLPQGYGTNGWLDLLNSSNAITETTTVTMTKERQVIVWKMR